MAVNLFPFESISPFDSTRIRPLEVDANADFVAECLRFWDKGFNTNEIAKILFQWEHVVETAIRIGRERRRQQEEDRAKEKEDDC